MKHNIQKAIIYTQKHYLLSNFILGLVLVLGFAPLNLWLFGILVPAALLFLWQQKHRNFLQGFMFGLGFFGLGASWVFVSIHTYGNANIFLAAILTLLFIVVLSLIPALQSYSYQNYFKTHPFIDALIIFPGLWALFEFLRGALFTGFPWLFLGYTQTFNGLSGFAKVFGIYGVSWVCAFLGAVIYLLGKKEIRRKIKLALLVIALLLLCIGSALKFYQFTKPLGKPVSVALVQGNIPETEKWDPKQVSNILLTYAKLTGPNLDSSLIIWPENAITMPPQYVMRFLDAIDHDTLTFKSAIIIGIPIENTLTQSIYNGALALGDADGMYLKRHLVPFGEYIPLQDFFVPIMQFFNIPLSYASPGPNQQFPMFIHGLPVSVFICYEVAYPVEVRNHLNRAAYLVTLTDDSWFGDSWASSQQNEMAAMRAIETGRPILNASNSGITSIINSNGNIISVAPSFVPYVLKGSIQPVKGATPWLEYGYLCFTLWVLFSLAGVGTYMWFTRKKAKR